MSEPASLRQKYADQTRQAILQAVAECLEESAHGDFSMSEVADRVGISVRTVFRHFPTRDDLLAAFGAWYEREMLPFQPLQNVRELPSIFARSAREMDRRPALWRSIATSSVGREVMTGFNALALHQLQDAVERDLAEATEAERQRLVAALHYLDSITSFVLLHDDLGLSGAEVGDVVSWMMRVVIDASEGEGAAAGRISAGKRGEK